MASFARIPDFTDESELCDRNPYFSTGAPIPISTYHLGGTTKVILDHLGVKFGFAYESHPVAGNRYTDIIRLMANKTTDMAVSSPSMSLERQLVSSFISSMGTRNIYIISYKPKQMPSYWTLFYPFTFYSWMAILASMVVVTLLLLFIESIMGHNRFFEVSH